MQLEDEPEVLAVNEGMGQGCFLLEEGLDPFWTAGSVSEAWARKSMKSNSSL